MSTSKKSSSSSEEPLELKDALAAIIANTRRNNRKLNLIEIAGKIGIAKKHLSTKEIADKVTLSKEMIREFERVNLLAAPLKVLVQDGKIRSVEIADRLSRLPGTDQCFVASEIIKGTLHSKDLRAIVSLKKSDPSLNISDVVQRIKESRNIREFVAEFIVPQHLPRQPRKIKESLTKVFGAEHIKSIFIQNEIVSVVFDSIAKDNLAKRAQKKGITKRELLRSIASGETNR
jgi:hypothetical protein